MFVDDYIKLSMRAIKQGGFLERVQTRIFTIEGKGLFGSGVKIEFRVSSYIEDGKRYIRIGTDKHLYDYLLESVPSNLGRGERWYFICPTTGKRVYNLYLSTGAVRTRHEIGSRYRSQHTSRADREIKQAFGYVFELQRMEDALFLRKWAKHHYRGVPTKEVQRIERTREKMAEGFYNSSFYPAQ